MLKFAYDAPKKSKPKQTEPFNGLLTCAGDSFTIQTIMHMILNTILSTWNNNFVYQYDAFFCQDKKKLDGYNIMELADLGDISRFFDTWVQNNMQGAILLDICQQVLLPLSLLKCKKYGFVHADLKCKNIFVQRSAGGSPIFKLADFDKSSIFWRNTRFYNNAVRPRVGKVQNVLDTVKKDGGYKSYKHSPDGSDYYKLSKLFPNEFFIMHSEVPMYMSYDIYTFLFSLMREPSVYGYLESKNYFSLRGDMNSDDRALNYFINNVWKPLWYEDDYLKISRSLAQTYRTYQEIPNQTKYLEKLRSSMGTLNRDLASGDYKFKVNIDHVYKALNVTPPSVYNLRIDDMDLEVPTAFPFPFAFPSAYRHVPNNIYMRLSVNKGGATRGYYHLCSSKCIDKSGRRTCKSNTYRYMSRRGRQIVDEARC